MSSYIFLLLFINRTQIYIIIEKKFAVTELPVKISVIRHIFAKNGHFSLSKSARQTYGTIMNCFSDKQAVENFWYFLNIFPSNFGCQVT